MSVQSLAVARKVHALLAVWLPGAVRQRRGVIFPVARSFVADGSAVDREALPVQHAAQVALRDVVAALRQRARARRAELCHVATNHWRGQCFAVVAT